MNTLHQRSPLVLKWTSNFFFNLTSRARDTSKIVLGATSSEAVCYFPTQQSRCVSINSIISELKLVNLSQSHPPLRFQTVLTCLGPYRGSARRCSSTALSRRRSTQNEASRQYLTSIGLDCERLQKSRPTVLRQNVRHLEQHVDLLRSLGLTNTDIVNIIYKEAAFLRKDVKAVFELVQYLKNVGLKDSQVANIFQRAPRFFGTPETVIDNIEYMKYLDVTDKNICCALIYTPSVFYRIQGGIERVASYLKQVMKEERFFGDQNRVIRYIMRNDPSLFMRQVSELENNVKFLKASGFHGEDLISIIRYCPSSIRIGTEFLEARLEYLQKHLALTRAALNDLIRRHPQLLHASVETIESHIALVLELGFTKEEMVRTPRIFSRSISSIRTRYEELTAVGCKPNLSSFIYSKEKHDLLVLKFKMYKHSKDKKITEIES